MLLLFLVATSFGVFLSSPKQVSQVLVFNKPKVSIDLSVFDSAQFKKLQPPPGVRPQYSYKAKTKANIEQDGFIIADNLDQAKKTLESKGLSVSDIKEVVAGRDNPFIQYYQPAPITAVKKLVPPSSAKK